MDKCERRVSSGDTKMCGEQYLAAAAYRSAVNGCDHNAISIEQTIEDVSHSPGHVEACATAF
jgi:hypothetical protein